MTHPDIPAEIRGTYAGLAHPAAIKHLTDLGVTAVELLPVHESASEVHVLKAGLVNYWGWQLAVLLRPALGLLIAPGVRGAGAGVQAHGQALHAAAWRSSWTSSTTTPARATSLAPR